MLPQHRTRHLGTRLARAHHTGAHARINDARAARMQDHRCIRAGKLTHRLLHCVRNLAR